MGCVYMAVTLLITGLLVYPPYYIIVSFLTLRSPKESLFLNYFELCYVVECFGLALKVLLEIFYTYCTIKAQLFLLTRLKST